MILLAVFLLAFSFSLSLPLSLFLSSEFPCILIFIEIHGVRLEMAFFDLVRIAFAYLPRLESKLKINYKHFFNREMLLPHHEPCSQQTVTMRNSWEENDKIKKRKTRWFRDRMRKRQAAMTAVALFIRKTYDWRQILLVFNHTTVTIFE